jgi:putative endopeptidase
LDNWRVFVFPFRMFKPTSLFLLGVFAATTIVLAQSEPQKSPAVGAAASKPPTIKDASKRPADQNPPVPMPSATAASADESAKPQVEKNPPPLDPKNMDTSVKPEEDFYLYANGGWIKRNPIPPEFSRWASFNELTEKNNDALHEICDKAAAAAPKESAKESVERAASADLQKVGDFYASGMNEPAVEAAKATPLGDELKRIDAMKDRADVLKEIAHLHAMGVGAFFGFTSGQDDKNSTMVIAQAFQGGLGLPDRDYYTKQDDASKKLRDQYLEHVTKMMALTGEAPDIASKHAKTILALETALAVPARTRVELRDPQKNYNKMKQAELQKLMPDWNWTDYFNGIDLKEPGDINVGQPDFFKAANKTFTATSLDDWKTYLRWHLIHDFAPTLSSDFVNENFEFFGKTLTGAQQLKPRWKRVVTVTDEVLGEALGKLYVAERFPPEAKARALEMVNNLKEALADRIKTLEWMDEPTKQEALKKLAAFTVKIGYPDKWRDYSMLMVDRGPYALNVMRGEKFEQDRELKKIGKPVDRSEWGMTPPTLNA